jgi:hypothetical protein
MKVQISASSWADSSLTRRYPVSQASTSPGTSGECSKKLTEVPRSYRYQLNPESSKSITLTEPSYTSRLASLVSAWTRP